MRMLVEINYRSIGDGREFLLDRLLPQGWFDRILGIHLGEKLLDAEPVHAQALVHYVVADTPGRLQQAPASFSDLQDSHWRDYRALREVGDEIQLSHSNKDYLGVLRMISPDATSLDARFAAALDDLRWVMA